MSEIGMQTAIDKMQWTVNNPKSKAPNGSMCANHALLTADESAAILAALRARADAAEELLAALKNVERTIRVSPRATRGLLAMKQARAAIAKAEACQPAREAPGPAGEER